MKVIPFSTLLLLTSFANAQAQEAIPLARGNTPGEPHHHLKIENEYVRAYYVEVPPHEATQLHQHDHDYLYVSLGPADVVSAVRDKPEVHLTLKDGETHFTRGGFAHVARNLADTPFRNVTIELLHQQQEPRNICKEVINGPIEDCSGPPITRFKDFPNKGLPLFETSEVFVQEIYLPETTPNTMELSGNPPVLIVSLANPGQKLQVPGKPKADFAAGEVVWLPTGQKCSIVAPRGSFLHVLILSF